MEVKTEKQIDYLLKITDKIGLIEHCRGNQPNYDEGWCVDDNARALQICLRYENLKLKNVKKIYFDFLKLALKDNGFYDDLNNDLTWKENFEIGGEHCGRALAALGEIINFDQDLSKEVKQIFDRIYGYVRQNVTLHTRVVAQTILGLQYYRSNEIDFWSEKLVDKYNQEINNEWKWFESEILYDSGRLPMALLVAYQKNEREKYFETAIESLNFLTKLIFDKENDYFSFPGNDGWFTKSGNRAKFGQQPVEAGSMVEVYTLAYEVTKNKKYKDLAVKAFDWFLGKNILGISLINEKTGGVYDGLEKEGASLNQGAESVLSYLIAAKEIEKLNRD